MPVIFNRDLSTIDSPLRSLLTPVGGVLELAAPERKDEFNALYQELAWRFEVNVSDGNFGFAADTLEDGNGGAKNVIYAPLAALERTWAYVYSYLTLFDATRSVPGVEVTRGYCGEVDDAFDLLNWANHAEKQKKRRDWPYALPRPDGTMIGPAKLQKVNNFFLGVLAFIFLHEVAHIKNGDTKVKGALPEEKQRAEWASDEWAAKWLLDRVANYSNDKDYRIERCNWIMLALSILNLVEWENREGLPTSHPPTLERVLKISENFCRESRDHVAPTTDFPLFLALTIIECQALNLGVGERLKTYDSLTDRLINLHSAFEKEYRP